MNSVSIVPLGKIAQEVKRRVGEGSEFPVYSVTKHRGFVPSLEYFKKQVFSRDTKGYKHVEPKEFAYATIHLDEGSVGICPEPSVISPMYTCFKVDESQVDGRYLLRYLKSPRALSRYSTMGKGSVHRRAAISFKRLSTLDIPLPPLPVQRRIAAILDKADALRAKRREAIAKCDQLLQSVFLEMFGDPVTNSKGWPVAPLPSLASKFCDGPFGSNLKSAHYTEDGVRVVRLQNIGVWEFLGNDVACISEEHFASLPRNHCLPGDVLIGTLGDPNLRACIQPIEIERALNKADCLLFRTNREKATPEYVCGLMNCAPLIKSAGGLALGQTRLRISMGRLKTLNVPIAPMIEQQKFSAAVHHISTIRLRFQRALEGSDGLFSSLQQSAFSGQLTA